MTERDFLAWEQRSRDAIDVKRCYIDLAGDLAAGVLLSQIIWWWTRLPSGARRSELVEHSDGWWLPRERSAWWAECRLTPKQFDRAAADLESRGLIEKSVRQHVGVPTVHVRPCLDRIVALLQGPPSSAEPPVEPGRVEKPSSQTGNIDLPESGISHARDPYQDIEVPKREGTAREIPASEDFGPPPRAVGVLPRVAEARSWIAAHEKLLRPTLGTLRGQGLDQVAGAVAFAAQHGQTLNAEFLAAVEEQARIFCGRLTGPIPPAVWAVELKKTIRGRRKGRGTGETISEQAARLYQEALEYEQRNPLGFG